MTGPPRTVHPHACGERSSDGSPRPDSSGSSPRLWGTSLLALSRWLSCRFIPTPVGNVAGRRDHPEQRSVHPHACGERFARLPRRVSAAGSSPRLWGTFNEGAPGRSLHRFIPTPVGNVPVLTPGGCRASVHPHACGERCSSPIARLPIPGSSPRLWGTCEYLRRIASVKRFIPTPVGNV